MYTAKQFVDDAKYIEAHRNTAYINQFPYNLGYYHSNGLLSFDCWNLGKALIWTNGEIKNNFTVGEHARQNGSLGDWDGWTMLLHCTDVSINFANITPGEMLLTPDKSHYGIYVGEFTDPSGVVNVVECTPAFGGGVVTSYVDAWGNRFDHKGGYQSYCWGWHGKMTEWLDYSEEPGPSPEPTGKIVVDGEFGPETIKKAQAVLSIDHPYVKFIDGEMSGQVESLIKAYVPAYVPGAWEFSGIGSPTVKAIQEVCAAHGLYSDTIDGIWGRNTSLGLQLFLNKQGFNLDVDGEFGYESTKAYQEFLNTF